LITKLTKIILAILFFLCLADLPYGYYQFVTFTSLVRFAILAEQAKKITPIIFVSLATLFNRALQI
jgi:hypothetical protein